MASSSDARATARGVNALELSRMLSLSINGRTHDLDIEPETGLLMGPGDHYEFVNAGSDDIFAVSVALHGSAGARAASSTATGGARRARRGRRTS